jgi:hypothetical protein
MTRNLQQQAVTEPRFKPGTPSIQFQKVISPSLYSAVSHMKQLISLTELLAGKKVKGKVAPVLN